MPARLIAHDDAARLSPYLRDLLRNRQQHVDAVRARLFQAYGHPEPGARADPLSDLIATILSQHTSDVNSDRAFARLRARFPSWEQVASAPVEEVAEAIRPGGLAAQKAPRIQQVLRAVHGRFGAYDLSVLYTMTRDEARALLMSLGSGIGPKTASCVLLFAVGLPAFCVDTHIQRICARLGVIGPRDGAEKAQHLLEATVPPEDTYALHVAMIRHGRQICRAQRPHCTQCPLRDLCLYGSTVP
jgi:endonuclease-3